MEKSIDVSRRCIAKAVWTAPVVASVALPVHAQTSEVSESSSTTASSSSSSATENSGNAANALPSCESDIVIGFGESCGAKTGQTRIVNVVNTGDTDVNVINIGRSDNDVFSPSLPVMLAAGDSFSARYASGLNCGAGDFDLTYNDPEFECL